MPFLPARPGTRKQKRHFKLKPAHLELLLTVLTDHLLVAHDINGPAIEHRCSDDDSSRGKVDTAGQGARAHDDQKGVLLEILLQDVAFLRGQSCFHKNE